MSTVLGVGGSPHSSSCSGFALALIVKPTSKTVNSAVLKDRSQDLLVLLNYIGNSIIVTSIVPPG
eukprot:scaffold12971_cov68-Cyclotella_meneghiniana.AAC.12